MISTAYIHGPYRYSLGRLWGSGKIIAWIMLNPSTADGEKDDATIRRVIDFSKAWGYDGFLVGNLFAFRATNPKEMLSSIDPVGPNNDTELLKIAKSCDRVVCAWGANGGFMNRDGEVYGLLSQHKLCHLGLTNGGQPKHPLYLSAETQLSEYVRP